MKKLLITGFDPFGGQTVNPAWEAVRALPEHIGEYGLVKLEVPTVFGKAVQAVSEKAEAVCPDVIVCVGQAGGRSKVTPEVVAINLRDASIADNEGLRPWNEPVISGAPDALFATLPVHKMVAAAEKQGLPCALSYSAGAFVCNDLLYSLLYRYQGTNVRVGFIHVPFLPEQAIDGVPSMPLDAITMTLTALLKAL